MNAPLNHPLLMLDPDVLRSFVAIAETGSFTAAAARIYRTPSAVSMQIKRLEEQLGVSVFLRDARNVALTHDGEVLLGYARRLIALNREAISRFVTSDVSGVVRIGSPSDYGEAVLPSVLKLFAKSHPSVVVDVVIDQSASLLKRFASGHIDIALVSCMKDQTPAPGEVMMTDDIVWAGARGGQAYLMDPLPVSMWDEGCVWRECAFGAGKGWPGIPGRIHDVAYGRAEGGNTGRSRGSAVGAEFHRAGYPASRRGLRTSGTRGISTAAQGWRRPIAAGLCAQRSFSGGF